METYRLVPHPDNPPVQVTSVTVEVYNKAADDVLLVYTVEGAGELHIPEWVSPGRSDELWKTTCFELFLASADEENYLEFNFSPSTRWAAYAFKGYRGGMAPFRVAVDPFIESRPGAEVFVCEADLDLTGTPPGALQMGLSAVIEEGQGVRSFWALTHAPGPPDFHNRDCFTATLAAPDGS